MNTQDPYATAEESASVMAKGLTPERRAAILRVAEMLDERHLSEQGVSSEAYTKGLADIAYELAEEAARNAQDAARYRWLRSRDVNTISQGGVFIGMTPENYVMNEEHADQYIDAALAAQAKQGAQQQ